MMEEKEPSLEIEEDVPDAIQEIISQICGSLETAINGSEFEDLGNCKFSIGDIKTIKGEEYTINNELILFDTKIEEKPFQFFIDIDSNSIEFFNDLNNSELTEQNTEEDVEDIQIEGLTDDEDAEDDEKQNEPLGDKQEVSTDENNTTDDSKSKNSSTQDGDNDDITKKESENKDELPIKEDENIDDSKEEEPSKKDKKIKLIIYILAGLIAVILISFFTAYFMGVFDPEPVVVKDINKTKKPKNNIIVVDIKNKQIDFKISMINKNRLNRRLKVLTKYDIIEDDALARFKQKEKERLYKLKMARLEEFASHNKEESLFKNNITNKTKSKHKNRFTTNESNKSNDIIYEHILENQKLTFIQIPSLKYKKYKDIIKREKTKSIQISICKNKEDKVDVYIGPIYIKTIVNNIFNAVNKTSKSNDAKIIILTKKEFDKRCDF